MTSTGLLGPLDQLKMTILNKPITIHSCKICKYEFSSSSRNHYSIRLLRCKVCLPVSTYGPRYLDNSSVRLSLFGPFEWVVGSRLIEIEGSPKEVETKAFQAFSRVTSVIRISYVYLGR